MRCAEQTSVTRSVRLFLAATRLAKVETMAIQPLRQISEIWHTACGIQACRQCPEVTLSWCEFRGITSGEMSPASGVVFGQHPGCWLFFA
jgi:hypothetical protein